MLDPLVVPDDEPPVVPDVPELLEVPAEPLDEGELEVEPLEEPMPEVESELVDEPLAPGLLEEPLDEGETEPVVAPVPDPIPEAEPEAVPEADGPVELQAASANAQARGAIHLIIFAPWLFIQNACTDDMRAPDRSFPVVKVPHPAGFCSRLKPCVSCA